VITTVCFGSIAALTNNNSLMAAFEREAELGRLTIRPAARGLNYATERTNDNSPVTAGNSGSKGRLSEVGTSLFAYPSNPASFTLTLGAAASEITETNSRLKIPPNTSCSHQARPSGSSRMPLAQSRRCVQICGSK